MGTPRELGKNVRNVWNIRPTLDVVITLVAVGVHLYLATRVSGTDLLGHASSEQRLAIYGAGAGVMSLIAGFAGTAIAQYGTAAGPAAQVVRRRFGKDIRKNWTSVVKWLLACALLCIVAMIIDRSAGPHGSQWTFEFALVMSVLKFARMTFLFRLIMSAIDFELNLPEVSVPQLRP